MNVIARKNECSKLVEKMEERLLIFRTNHISKQQQTWYNGLVWEDLWHIDRGRKSNASKLFLTAVCTTNSSNNFYNILLH